MKTSNLQSLSFALFLSLPGIGCRTSTKPTGIRTILNSTNAHVRLVHYDATRRGVYIVQHGVGDVRIAAEPPPDAAMAVAAEFIGKVSGMGAQATGGELNAKLNESIVELAGRGQVVTLARDALYRLAEMYVNEAIEKEEYQKQYSKILEMITTLVTAESKRVNLPESLINSAVERAELSDSFTKTVLQSLDEVQNKYVSEVEKRGTAEGERENMKADTATAKAEARNANAEVQKMEGKLESAQAEVKTLKEEVEKEKGRADTSDRLRKQFLQSINSVRTPLQALLADKDVVEATKSELQKILISINAAESAPAAP